MNLPIQAAPVMRGHARSHQTQMLSQQGVCELCCIPKAGFVACVARCHLDGQACDGGLNNCSGC
jgi:hypothetical protein